MNNKDNVFDIVIADEIRCMIFEDQILGLGDKLPSENELCLRFKCSKETLRQSLETLKNESVLDKINDEWYVVKQPRIRKYINRFESLSKNLENSHTAYSKKMITNEILKVDSKLAHLTHLPLGSEAFYFERLRYVNNIPVCIECNYISKSLCPKLNHFDIENNSLYEVLKTQYNISIDRGIEEITIIEATIHEAKLLNVDEKTPLIKQYGFIFSDEGDEIEYSENIMNIERFEFVK